MRQKYLDVVDEVEVLKDDLDAVSRDLDRLASGRGVELHATVDKFGKTANLKLHDAPLGEGEEEPPPPKYTGLKLFKKPNVRQVFNTLFFRANDSISFTGFCIEASKWRKRGLWNSLSIYSTSESLLSMPRLSHQLPMPSNYIFSR